jgi:hypothetical protein
MEFYLFRIHFKGRIHPFVEFTHKNGDRSRSCN